ncbi:hypothetical protein EJ110_NYTH11047 [Nymphaea thermarum]|nr:hypothetical protein EJ110_NYTH11047 [Nymphaea thermarum]
MAQNNQRLLVSTSKSAKEASERNDEDGAPSLIDVANGYPTDLTSGPCGFSGPHIDTLKP